MGYTHTLAQLQKPPCSLRCIWSQQGEQPIYLMSPVQVCVPVCVSFVGQSVVKTNLCRFPQVTLEQPLIGHTHIHLHAHTHTHIHTHTQASIRWKDYGCAPARVNSWVTELKLLCPRLQTFSESWMRTKIILTLMIKSRTVCGWVGKPQRTN